MCADAPATLTNMAPDVLYVENRTLLKGATLGAGEQCLPKGGDCEWGKKKCCSGWCITPAGSTDGKPMCADAPATLTNMAPDVLYVENRTLLKGATLGAGEECLPKGGDCLFGKKKCCSGWCITPA